MDDLLNTNIPSKKEIKVIKKSQDKSESDISTEIKKESNLHPNDPYIGSSESHI